MRKSAGATQMSRGIIIKVGRHGANSAGFISASWPGGKGKEETHQTFAMDSSLSSGKISEIVLLAAVSIHHTCQLTNIRLNGVVYRINRFLEVGNAEISGN